MLLCESTFLSSCTLEVIGENSFLQNRLNHIFAHSCFTVQLCTSLKSMQTVVFFSLSPSSQCCFVPFVFSREFVSASSLNINLPFQLCLKFQLIYFYFSGMLLWSVEKNFWPSLACPCSCSRSFEIVLIDHLHSPLAEITSAVMLILWNFSSVAVLEIHPVLLKPIEFWPMTFNKVTLLFLLRCQMYLNRSYRHKVEYQINPSLS